MHRLPIRWKLTLAFALGLTVVLTAVGVFLHAQLSANVDAGIERDLRRRADQLRELVTQSPVSALPTNSENLEPDEKIAHILAPAGGVVAASSHADIEGTALGRAVGSEAGGEGDRAAARQGEEDRSVAG
jgi:hypothetical protein